MIILILLSCCSFTFPTLFFFAAIAIVILLLGTACSAALCRYATRRWLHLARAHTHTDTYTGKPRSIWQKKMRNTGEPDVSV